MVHSLWPPTLTTVVDNWIRSLRHLESFRRHAAQSDAGSRQAASQSMLARLRGMMQTLKSIDPPPGKVEESRPELLPTWDVAKVSESAQPPETVAPAEIAHTGLPVTAPLRTKRSCLATAPNALHEIRLPPGVGDMLVHCLWFGESGSGPELLRGLRLDFPCARNSGAGGRREANSRSI